MAECLMTPQGMCAEKHDTGMLNVQVLSPEHAKTFSAMEYFNTYGGCTAAGAAGMAVLKVLQDEQLQQHARRVGQYLLSQLAPIEQVRTLDMQRACTARGGPLSREGCVEQKLL